MAIKINCKLIINRSMIILTNIISYINTNNIYIYKMKTAAGRHFFLFQLKFNNKNIKIVINIRLNTYK